MSYETVRRLLDRSKNREADSEDGGATNADLIDALEALAAALEADLAQIKAALSHVAHLLEDDRSE